MQRSNLLRHCPILSTFGFCNTRLLSLIIPLLMGVFLLNPLPAYATLLDIIPTHLYLSDHARIESLTLKNLGDEPIVMQLALRHWTQSKDKNFYRKTKDLLVVPHVCRIPAHSRQIVRVALRGQPDVHEERAYRLYLRQVLPTKEKLSSNHNKEKESLRVAVRMSLPVFVSPQVARLDRWQWRARRHSTGHRLALTLTNTGNTTLFINHIQIYTKNNQPMVQPGKVFSYILPHQKHTWLLKLSKGARHLSPNSVKANINHHDKISQIH